MIVLAMASMRARMLRVQYTYKHMICVSMLIRVSRQISRHLYT